MIKAVAYDVDGLLVDSEPLHVLAWQEALLENGRDFAELPAKFHATMAGRKPLAIAEFIVASLSVPVSGENFLSQKQAKFIQKVKTDLRPMSGASESVIRLETDYTLGIGTSLDRMYLDLVLNGLNISGHFRAIVTGDKIRKGKPDPETYLTLAAQLGVNPAEMLVLEDAASGIASAKAAGCWCIAVENKQAASQDTTAADTTVPSLDMVTRELITSLVNL